MVNEILFNEITIVIPTYNRHNYLNRILEMYRPFNIKIVIADSTTNKYSNNYLNKETIKYIHTPNKDVSLKWTETLNFVNTKYVVFCADDDFIFPDALIQSINFLNYNDDFVCAQGSLLFYKYVVHNSDIEYNLTDSSKFDLLHYNSLSVDSDTLEDRLYSYSVPYRHNIYGVHRLNNIKKIYNHIILYDIAEPYLFEFAQAILTIISGKVKELEMLYQLREYITTSGGRNSKNILQLYNEQNKGISTVKQVIIDWMIMYNNIDEEQAIKLADIAFNNMVIFMKKFLHKNVLGISYRILVDKCNEIDSLYLNELYRNTPYLKNIEKIIYKHNINSGYYFQTNESKKYLPSQVSSLFSVIERLGNLLDDKRIAVYGAGTISAILKRLYNNQICFLVDQNSSLHNEYIFPLEYLFNNQEKYDIILITVLGREEEIIYYLQEKLGITKPIITIDI